MSYSYDMRKRAVSLVRGGSSQLEISRIIGITRRTLYNWLHADDLHPRPAKSRHRKIDKVALAAHVRDYPDALLRERAQLFGVHVSCISRALKRLHIHKKTTRYAQINHKERCKFIGALRTWISRHGSTNVVYFDESGFAKHSYRPHGWAKRGVKVFGKISGNNRKVTNLIMAQRGKEWLAPMLFEGSCTHHTVAAWIKQALLPNSGQTP